MAISPLGTLTGMLGMAIGANGKLIDNSRFARAGLVHGDEYMRSGRARTRRRQPWSSGSKPSACAATLREGYRWGHAAGGGCRADVGWRAYLHRAAAAAGASETADHAIGRREGLAPAAGSVALHLGELDERQAERKQVQLEMESGRKSSL
jgi:hypothetical protein